MKLTYSILKSFLYIGFSVGVNKNNSYILYVMSGNNKIKICYFNGGKIKINMEGIEGVVLDIRVYSVEDGVSSLLVLDRNLIFIDIEKKLYRNIIGGNYSNLLKNGYICRSGATAIDVSGKINWRNLDRNIEFNLNSWRFLQPIWSEYFISYKVELLNEILRVVLEYYDYMFFDQKHKKFLWYDMSCAIRGIHLSLINLVLKFDINSNVSEIRIKVEDMLNSHINKLLDPSFLSSGNHGLWQIISIKILGLSLKSSNNVLENYANTCFDGLFNEIINADNYSSENSPGYHKYICEMLATIPAGAFPKFSQRIKSIVKSKEYVLSYFTDYNGDLFSIGDTEGKGYLKPNEKSKTEFYKLYLPDSNCFVVKNDNSKSLISISATNKNKIHKHADNLSVILGCDGILIMTDAGKYTYNYGELRNYFISDRAHNVLCLEGEVFYPKDINQNEIDFKVDTSKVIDLHVYGRSSYEKLSDKFIWSRDLTIHKEFNVTVVDRILCNDFNKRPFLNFIFNQDIVVKLKDSKTVLVSEDNMDLIEIIFKEIPSEIKISENWLSKSYHNKQLTSNLQVYFSHESDFISWEVKKLS